jgi:hypothetical protein
MNAKQKQVLENPVKDWAHQLPGAKPILLSWEGAVRGGLADKAQAQVDQLTPQIDRLKFMIRQGQARALTHPGEEMVVHERRRQLAVLEPELERWSAFLKACAPWIGHGGKALDKALAAADAAVVEAEEPVAELDEVRRESGRLAALAGVEGKEAGAAMDGIAGPLRARLVAARQVATAARTERDENAARVSELEAELASLGRRRVA